jgi:hypothetical protein
MKDGFQATGLRRHTTGWLLRPRDCPKQTSSGVLFAATRLHLPCWVPAAKLLTCATSQGPWAWRSAGLLGRVWGPRRGTQNNSADAGHRTDSTVTLGTRLRPRRLPLPKMAVHALPPQPLPADSPGSIRGRQLPRVQTPLANGEGQRGAVGLGSDVGGPVRMQHVGGCSGHPPMGSPGVRPEPGGGAARRVRFSRSSVAAAAEEEEDVGHARAGGSAGPERAPGRPDAAAGRLRRCGGHGPALRGRPGGGAETHKTSERPGWGGWRLPGPVGSARRRA